MHGLALDRSGPNQRDLHREVVERFRFHLREGRHLRPGLHLEDPDRVRSREHLVDGRFLRDRGQVDDDAVRIRDRVNGEVEGVEHAESEEIELDDSDRGAVVLVPLQHGPILHPAPLHGDDLPQRTVGDHHSARMDAKMSGKPVEPVAHVVDELGGHSRRQRRLQPQFRRIASIDVLGQAIHLSLGQPEGFADITQHRAGTVGDDIGDHRRTFTPVSAVAVLDDLLPALGLEVEIDVRRPPPLVGEEPLERQVQPNRIDPGEADATTHRRVGA
ncbi:hypothetical protein BMS3Bbin01_00943 [bacterium BMS3Bbin01]|nr:hypothetical protein BMS3Bbin01_00943 [bacterium BMS3Bbin01]